MPLPLFLIGLGEAGAAVGVRVAVGRALSAAGLWVARVLGSRVAVAALAGWGLYKEISYTLQEVQDARQVLDSFIAVKNMTDGAIIGAFPAPMQPMVEFFNYFFPITDTYLCLTALGALYLAINAMIIAVQAWKFVLRHGERG